jgi:hypothetical protein
VPDFVFHHQVRKWFLTPFFPFLTPFLRRSILENSAEWHDLDLAIWPACPMLLNMSLPNRYATLGERFKLLKRERMPCPRMMIDKKRGVRSAVLPLQVAINHGTQSGVLRLATWTGQKQSSGRQ